MEGKRKEKKLIINNLVEPRKTCLMDEIKRIVEVISNPSNMFCRDTYYDDENDTLLNQGGSLKIREKVQGSRKKTLIMRTKTAVPQKIKYSLWDEVEIPVIRLEQGEKFIEIFSPLKAFFPQFDFSSISLTPVLICSTSRLQYDVIKSGERITLMLDHIDYEAGGRKAEDNLLKIRGYSIKAEPIIKEIYQFLLEQFPECELINLSRYERALERLNA
ncbi:MAG: hypothetical protein K1W33_02395 [Clostridia bacterium]|nr:hypothetical protein [Clostridia bacterium]